jgi:hypothetical protein
MLSIDLNFIRNFLSLKNINEKNIRITKIFQGGSNKILFIKTKKNLDFIIKSRFFSRSKWNF